MEKLSKEKNKILKKLIRNKVFRYKTSLFVVDGIKIINDLLDKGFIPEYILVAENIISAKDLSYLSNVPLYYLDNTQFQKISSLNSSQGMIAVFKMKKQLLLDEIKEKDKQLGVLCDNLQDPGNLGTIIRTSLAFGIDFILLTNNSVDLYNNKVIRASAGACFSIPIYYVDFYQLTNLKPCFQYVCSVVKKKKVLKLEEIYKLRGNTILVFGNEGHGVGKDVLSLTDLSYSIPISNAIESLNVSAAVAITLYHFSLIKK